jgi:hypothetical protein
MTTTRTSSSELHHPCARKRHRPLPPLPLRVVNITSVFVNSKLDAVSSSTLADYVMMITQIARAKLKWTVMLLRKSNAFSVELNNRCLTNALTATFNLANISAMFVISMTTKIKASTTVKAADYAVLEEERITNTVTNVKPVMQTLIIQNISVFNMRLKAIVLFA